MTRHGKGLSCSTALPELSMCGTMHPLVHIPLSTSPAAVCLFATDACPVDMPTPVCGSEMCRWQVVTANTSELLQQLAVCSPSMNPQSASFDQIGDSCHCALKRNIRPHTHLACTHVPTMHTQHTYTRRDTHAGHQLVCTDHMHLSLNTTS